ncbi:bifunctional diaminohydroxyphosphoribosylaminopyrimidine deaminase/5-amino-6-(5-phosphoribosylamino)uracil reductase RibD [Peteryoungia ipomoeae]|uniref:Riboflavin biosynthesis protein RibD n=1 Tax=Peteryoungia ipomoeae TaxID=1210932 RepID=A0A4S8P9A0_9HYPH|nr:bifunctional diaminohydroxyphosphoribosylaminopyrimidine deaminase/5-amino-6-(5-phosphoribosylamino)uracil reductase RibD [Peteryoungia ipomoeae]THV25622.1 bifunctional diaminohydroxyphosphoribosylaminopyrimidine deaminase/5-amino-6-(5-phosphoribosylamino)uracil reductase RibD [Peteryoungia ipomoeae]
MSSSLQDEIFMREAIALSLTHLGRTGANPSVGCVIVKHGEIVGRGVTAEGGRPHAEPQALAEAGTQSQGATAYVTLEPCSHHGKTPPCADAMIRAGVSRVVVAVADPDPRVSGQGLKMLADAGIEVTIGILQKEARFALSGYLMRQTRGRPQVTLKLAVSRDGMLGLRGAGQVRITGDAAREDVHRLRAESDAILVGVGTAIADDPELTVRLPGLVHTSPLRIVLDRTYRLPLNSKLVRQAQVVPTIVVGRAVPAAAGEGAAISARRTALHDAGVECLDLSSLSDLLTDLAHRGISNLMVEGGAEVARAFLAAGLVDRLWLYQGNVTLGADGIASPVVPDQAPLGFEVAEQRALGDDSLTIFRRQTIARYE